MYIFTNIYFEENYCKRLFFAKLYNIGHNKIK